MTIHRRGADWAMPTRCDLPDRPLALPDEIRGSPPELLGEAQNVGLLSGDIVFWRQCLGTRAAREVTRDVVARV